MKKFNFRLLFIFSLALLSFSLPCLANDATGVAEKVPQEATKNEGIFKKYIAGHLQIGTRSVYRILTDDDSGHKGGSYGSGTYLGTVYGLDEEQNVAPIYASIAYYFNKYLGMEISYDRMEAKALAVNVTTLQDKSDGNVTLAGPTLNLLAKYPNATRFSPYLGVGLGFYSGSFDPDSEWESESQHSGRAYNHMDVDNVVGLIFTLGSEWNVTEHWLLDLSTQYVSADVDATYHGYYNNILYTTQTGHFPLDNVAFRIGLAYKF